MLPAANSASPPFTLFLTHPPSLPSDVNQRRPCSTLSLFTPLTPSLPSFLPIAFKAASTTNCFRQPTPEDHLTDSENTTSSSTHINFNVSQNQNASLITQHSHNATLKESNDFLSFGIPEPVYQVVEVKSDGTVSNKSINRRQLLKSSGLRPRDIRSVDPSLWLTNSMPSLLVNIMYTFFATFRQGGLGFGEFASLVNILVRENLKEKGNDFMAEFPLRNARIEGSEICGLVFLMS